MCDTAQFFIKSVKNTSFGIIPECFEPLVINFQPFRTLFIFFVKKFSFLKEKWNVISASVPRKIVKKIKKR